MVKDQYPLGSSVPTAEALSALWDRIARECQGARADRRDGLRLDWDDRWVHIRSSNTEPIVRVIAEASDGTLARKLADAAGEWVQGFRDRER